MSVMDKNWLIRTRQHQILGPISKSKVIELLEKSSLLDDDELSSGNGYWFQVKETDLMNKYVYGDIVQSFNPISEGESVLTLAPENKSQTASINPSTLPRETDDSGQESEPEDSDLLPDETDLEYPDFDMDVGVNSQTDNTVVTQIPKELLEAKSEQQEIKGKDDISTEPISISSDSSEEGDHLLPEDGDLEYPDLGGSTHSAEMKTPQVVEDEIPVLDEEEADVEDNKKDEKKTYATLIMAVLVLTGIFYGVYYYYTKILNKPIPFFSQISVKQSIGLLIPEVSATSELKALSKKKK